MQETSAQHQIMVVSCVLFAGIVLALTAATADNQDDPQQHQTERPQEWQLHLGLTEGVAGGGSLYQRHPVAATLTELNPS